MARVFMKNNRSPVWYCASSLAVSQTSAGVLPKINSSSGCDYSEFFTRALELILRSGADGAGPVAAHKRSLPTSPDDGRDAG